MGITAPVALSQDTGQPSFAVVVVGFVEVPKILACLTFLAILLTRRSADADGWVLFRLDAPAPGSPACFVGFVRFRSVGKTPGCAYFFVRTGAHTQLARFAILVVGTGHGFLVADLSLNADLAVGAACVGATSGFAFSTVTRFALGAVVGGAASLGAYGYTEPIVT